MENFELQQRVKQLSNDKGYFSNETNLKLFKQYLQKLKLNVPKQDIDERTLLVEGNKRIVFHILKSRTNINLNYENSEEYSVCMIGLIKSIDSYNIDSTVKFVTYAIKVINNELNMYYRKINQSGNYAERTKVYFDDVISTLSTDGRLLTYNDYLKDDENFIDEVIKEDTFQNIVKNFKYLKPKEQAILIHYYGLFGNEPKTQIEISKMFNLCRASISRQYTSAIKKLKILSTNNNELTAEQIKLKKQLLKIDNQTNLEESQEHFF